VREACEAMKHEQVRVAVYIHGLLWVAYTHNVCFTYEGLELWPVSRAPGTEFRSSGPVSAHGRVAQGIARQCVGVVSRPIHSPLPHVVAERVAVRANVS
jgi:hypothetical protein